MIRVYVDCGAFEFIFNAGIDIIEQLPQPRFQICFTAETSIEIEHIRPDKPELRTLITDALETGAIKIIKPFGFAGPNSGIDKRLVAGWGEGKWISAHNLNFRRKDLADKEERRRKEKEKRQKNARLDNQEMPQRAKKPKGSGLHNDQADRALAAESFDALVLTSDVKKAGPFKTALATEGNHVVYIDQRNPLGNCRSLLELIEQSVPEFSKLDAQNSQTPPTTIIGEISGR